MNELSREQEFAAYIGVDWGNEQHHVSLYEPGRGLEHLVLKHTAQGVHSWLKGLCERFGGRPVALGLETSKGPLIGALYEHLPWCTVYPIHSTTTARLREAFKPSGAKDDRPDAELNLEVVRFHRHQLRPLQLEDEATRVLEGLVQFRRCVVDQRTEVTNRLQATLKEVFPQAWSLVGCRLDTAMALDLLERWPDLAKLKRARPSAIRSFYCAHNVRRPEVIEERIQQIKQAVFLTKDQALLQLAQTKIKLLVGQIRLLQKQVAEVEKQIGTLFASHPEAPLFQDLPGAGKAMAPRLLALFGTDRSKYPEAASVQKYAGVAPVKEASGAQVWIHWRRHVPIFSRQTLVEWAGQTVVYSQWAKDYYDYYKAQNKTHHVILRALAFKWLRVLWRCWQDRVPYDEPRYMQKLRAKNVPYLRADNLVNTTASKT